MSDNRNDAATRTHPRLDFFDAEILLAERNLQVDALKEENSALWAFVRAVDAMVFGGKSPADVEIGRVRKALDQYEAER